MGALASLMTAGSVEEEGRSRVALDHANAYYSQQAAIMARAKGANQAGLARMRGSQMVAEQKTGYAQGNIDSGVGTPLATQASTAMMSELDAQTLKNNAAREARGHDVKALQHEKEAELDSSRTDDQRNASVIGGILGTVSLGMGGSSGGYQGGYTSGGGGGDIAI